MNQLIQSKTLTTLIVSAAVLVCISLLPRAQAVVPAPDGAYPGGNTAEGRDALFHRTTGIWNTAFGFNALYHDTKGNSNTAVGFNALLHNTEGIQNTAIGVGALKSNTGGFQNTANGVNALVSNATGVWNTASGVDALKGNIFGSGNTAIGYQALFSNAIGDANTAIGFYALFGIEGICNTAIGNYAGFGNSSGNYNVYIGAAAHRDESGTIRIGDPTSVGACYLAGIDEATVDPSTGTAVFVDADGKLGTVVSSKRFKDEIKPMDKTSEAVLALKPVTFHYKKDTKGIPQFGLVAEDVAEVNPDLVVRDKNGEIYTVRYDAVNAMLLNEFLKAHSKMEEQEASIAQLKKELQATAAHQQKQIDALTAGLQKVSAQLEASKPAPQVVNNP